MATWSPFGMQDSFEADGALRLALWGELDLAVAERLRERLEQLMREGYRVRLDLSRLEFIDSSGVHVVIAELTDARREGGGLEIAPQVSDRVRRTIELLKLEAFLWPTNGD
jgi:anti-anti-sigma factor